MKKNEEKKYGKIINNLIKKSFPILKNKKIPVKKALIPFLFKYSAAASIDPIFKKPKIVINPKYCKNYNDFEIKGVFAHELSHLEDFLSESRWQIFINSIKYTFSKKYKEKYEKNTDKKAICKGYRKELKAAREKRIKMKDKNYEKNKEFYLTPKEIDKVICK